MNRRRSLHNALPLLGRALYRAQCWLLIAAFCLLSGPFEARAALFGKFGVHDELELGRQFDILIRARLPLIEDPEIKRYVQSIVERLSKAIPPQPFTFNANVLVDGSLNAFAVPGGYVFVHTGLIMGLETEDQLAGVLAHELAHVTQRHVASRIERGQTVSLLSMLGVLAGVFVGGSATSAVVSGSMAAGQSAMLNYSRSDETEADQMALQYLMKAGFDPNGLTKAFEIIRKKQMATGRDVPTYMSTHPDVNARINEMSARIGSMPGAKSIKASDNKRFLRVQALTWARYSDPESASRHFLGKAGGEKNCLTLMGQGILAARRNRMPEADAAFQKAIACDSKDALIWREAGRFYYALGDNRAQDALNRALALDPRDVMAQFFYARTLDSMGNRPEAHKFYKEVLRYVPEDSEVHYFYGRSLGEDGRKFDAYLHLTYSAMYENDAKKTRNWLKQLRGLVQSQAQKDELGRLEAVLKERSSFWDDKRVLE